MERGKGTRNSNKGNQGKGKGNKTLRKEQAKNRAGFWVLYRSQKGAEQAIQKGGVEAAKQGSSSCKEKWPSVTE